jgi:hypothetical protein
VKYFRCAVALFFFALFLCSFCADADEPNPIVDRENFSALVFETSGGFAGIESRLEIRTSEDDSKPFSLNWSYTVQKRGLARNVDLSSKEETALLAAVNDANLPDLNGKEFKQKHLADGFNEVLALTLESGEKFVVQNYGDAAPPEYFALTKFLRELQAKKFPQS